MKVYLLESDNFAYDAFDSAVVTAVNGLQASLIHPSEEYRWDTTRGLWKHKKTDKIVEGWMQKNLTEEWCRGDEVKVTLIATMAVSDVEKILCTSYNAG